jgi:hypothetical protein
MMVQKIRKRYRTPYDKAAMYLTIINELNGKKLRKMEIELLAFIATGGNINGFIKHAKSSQASVGNMRARLMKSGWLVKDEEVVRVTPAIELDFEGDITLHVTLEDSIITKKDG